MTTARITFDQAAHKVATRVTKMRSSAVRDLFAAAVRPDIISLSGGMPDVSLLPATAIRKATRAALEDQRAVALQYGSTDGRLATKQVFCDILRDIGVRVKPDEVLLTSGAQQALAARHAHGNAGRILEVRDDVAELQARVSLADTLELLLQKIHAHALFVELDAMNVRLVCRERL